MDISKILSESPTKITDINPISVDDSVLREGTFRVKSYKLVIRKTVDIENGERPLDKIVAQDYNVARNKALNGEDAIFTPIYIMNWVSPKEKFNYVHYYGKTNSSHHRFRNHDTLNDFERGLPGMNQRVLYMCQVFVTYCHMYKEYKDIPLEWLLFHVDDDRSKDQEGKEKRKERIDLLKELKEDKKDSWISYHNEIDKIILFIENALIARGSSGNKVIYFPRSLYDIYTLDISIIENTGKLFRAVNGIHQPKILEEETNRWEELNIPTDMMDTVSEEGHGVKALEQKLNQLSEKDIPKIIEPVSICPSHGGECGYAEHTPDQKLEFYRGLITEEKSEIPPKELNELLWLVEDSEIE